MLFEGVNINPDIFIWVWLGVIVLSLVIEFITDELVSIWFVVGGIVSWILSLCKIDIGIQLIVFVIASFAFMLVARPFLKKYLNRNEIKTNVDALIGRIAVVLKKIEVGERGLVKIDGVEWSAVANDDIDEGARVEILSIEGNKLIVKEHKKSENNVQYI